MIVTEQMDQAMNEQSFDFDRERMSRFLSLTGCDRNGDNYIAEHVRLNMKEPPFAQRE